MTMHVPTPKAAFSRLFESVSASHHISCQEMSGMKNVISQTLAHAFEL